MASEWTGKRLQELMEVGEWDEIDMAARVGASPGSIRNWLQDKCQMGKIYRQRLDRIERGLQSRMVAQ